VPAGSGGGTVAGGSTWVLRIEPAPDE
jgi:hypothetical protein